MESISRLRLIRALHAYSQQELAELVETGSTFIAAIEKGRKKLPEKLARKIADKLAVDEYWLLDEDWKHPLQSTHLLIVDFPPRKILAAARNIRQLRLNDSITIIKDLWPQLLADNPVKKCWVAEMAEDLTIVLVVFKASNHQGILFRITGVNTLAESIIQSLRNCDGVELNTVGIDKECFYGTSDKSYVSMFLDRCGVKGDLRDKFEFAAKNILPANATQVNELSGKTRRSLLEKVCIEIMENDIKIDEIIKFLNQSGRDDLTTPLKFEL